MRDSRLHSVGVETNRAILVLGAKHLGEDFNGQNKEVGGERITLSKATSTFEITAKLPINCHRITRRSDTLLDQISKTLWELHCFHRIHNKIPIKGIKSFLEIDL